MDSRADISPDFSLDSSYFVAFEMAHNALKQGLEAASSLSITAYRILAKLTQTNVPINQGKLGERLGLKANVVSQSLDSLTELGLVSRTAGATDGRQRFLAVTDAGRDHVATVNKSLVESLYATFPTENPVYRTILEAAIAAGSSIEPPLEPGRPTKFPATRALTALELMRQTTADALKDVCGASFIDCRIIQRAAELNHPVRIGDLADQLVMAPINVTRSVDRLQQRGWIRKLRSPEDRKAVYLELTDEGRYQAMVVNTTVNELGRTYLWANLTADQKETIEKMGHVVMADLIALKEARTQAALNNLIPL